MAVQVRGAKVVDLSKDDIQDIGILRAMVSTSSVVFDTTDAEFWSDIMPMLQIIKTTSPCDCSYCS